MMGSQSSSSASSSAAAASSTVPKKSARAVHCLVVVNAPFIPCYEPRNGYAYRPKQGETPAVGYSGLLTQVLQQRQTAPEILEALEFTEIRPHRHGNDGAAALREMSSLPLDTFDAIVISGGATDVTDNAPWLNSELRWLADSVLKPHVKVPVLGICLGHQLLSTALGGRVGNCTEAGAPVRDFYEGVFHAVATDEAESCPIFGGFHKEKDPVGVLSIHHQKILKLPDCAKILMTAAHPDGEPYQALRYDIRSVDGVERAPCWSIQHHSEYHYVYLTQRFGTAEFVEGKTWARSQDSLKAFIEYVFKNVRSS